MNTIKSVAADLKAFVAKINAKPAKGPDGKPLDKTTMTADHKSELSTLIDAIDNATTGTIKEASANLRAFVTKLEGQTGSNTTNFTPAHKDEFDALVAKAESVTS